MSGSLSPAIGQPFVAKNVLPPRASISCGASPQGCHTSPLIAGPAELAGTSKALSPAACAVETAKTNKVAIIDVRQRIVAPWESEKVRLLAAIRVERVNLGVTCDPLFRGHRALAMKASSALHLATSPKPAFVWSWAL